MFSLSQGQASNRGIANFKPYTYWSLVSLSCAVTQHLATIFTFISVFVHLKEQLLDPRTLIWLSAGCFVSGYTLWVLFDQTQVAFNERINGRLCPVADFLDCRNAHQFRFISSQNLQIFHSYFPSPFVLVSGAADLNRIDVVRLHLGTFSNPPLVECYLGRLQYA
jgi:hypothetical protein